MKNKRGFTLIELLIAITLLGVIMTVTSSVFGVTLRSYRLNIQKSFFQKDLNFSLDSMANNAKSASLVVPSNNGYTSSQNTLILAVPTKNQSGEFVYTANILEYDYYIYYLANNELHKRLYGNSNGILTGQNGVDSTISENVSNFNITYNPDINNASGVSITLALSKNIGGHDVAVSQTRTANLRNKQ